MQARYKLMNVLIGYSIVTKGCIRQPPSQYGLLNSFRTLLSFVVASLVTKQTYVLSLFYLPYSCHLSISGDCINVITPLVLCTLNKSNNFSTTKGSSVFAKVNENIILQQLHYTWLCLNTYMLKRRFFLTRRVSHKQRERDECRRERKAESNTERKRVDKHSRRCLHIQHNYRY